MKSIFFAMIIVSSFSCRHTSRNSSLNTDDSKVIPEIDGVKFSRDNVECSFLCYLLKDKRIQIDHKKKCSIEFQIDGHQAKSVVIDDSGRNWGTIAKISISGDGSTGHWLAERPESPLEVSYLADVNQLTIRGEELLVMTHPDKGTKHLKFDEEESNNSFFLCKANDQSGQNREDSQYVINISDLDGAKGELYKLTENYANLADDSMGWELVMKIKQSESDDLFQYDENNLSLGKTAEKLDWESIKESDKDLWNKGWVVHKGDKLVLAKDASGSFVGTYEDNLLLDVRSDFEGPRPALTPPVKDKLTCAKSTAKDINLIAPKSLLID